jgi:hypothetical protein
MLVCVFYVHFARETAGAARIRLSLRPLLSRRVKDDANLGRIAPRECEVISRRHCEERKRRSNPPFFLSAKKLDCFASLAMTVSSVRIVVV